MIDIPKLTVDHIEQVYTGRPGCMCGCKGQYRDSARSKKIILNKILKNPLRQISDDVIWVDLGTRLLAAYFSEEFIDLMHRQRLRNDLLSVVDAL